MTDLSGIAARFEQGIEAVKEFVALPHAEKVKEVRDYLDAEIGEEMTAEIKSVKIPGIGITIEGGTLEKYSDMILSAVATMIVNKFFSSSES